MELLYAVLAGASVVTTTAAARRFGGRIGGILAAAPVTPTFAVLALGASPELLVQGMPVVAMTALVAVLVLRARPRTFALLPLGLAGPLGWTLVLAGAALIAARAPLDQARRRPRPVPWPVRFAVGAGTVLVVALAGRLAPAIAPYLAMAPWLFVAAIGAAALDGGIPALRQILRGGMAGAAGVAAFAWVAAWTGAWGHWALGAGWGAFALVAWAWSAVPVAGPGVENPFVETLTINAHDE